MINTQLERLVQTALSAFVESFPSADEYRKNMFELELRRKFMELYCNDNRVTNTHTYTINPGTVTGKWTTRECPPATSQLLNG